MRGLNITATGAGPAHALYFACYEKLKKTLSDVIHAGGNSHVANGTGPATPGWERGGSGRFGGREAGPAAGSGCHGCPKALCSLQPHGAGHGEAPLRACQSCCQVSGLKQVSGPGSEGCWWTGAACRQAGTGRGPVGWQCQSSRRECRVVLEPVSPWCPLLVSRTHHSRRSMGLRGEQGTFRPWQVQPGV
ncbi:hypothetical protein Nmel_010373 [Mimus melanotis]